MRGFLKSCQAFLFDLFALSVKRYFFVTKTRYWKSIDIMFQKIGMLSRVEIKINSSLKNQSCKLEASPIRNRTQLQQWPKLKISSAVMRAIILAEVRYNSRRNISVEGALSHLALRFCIIEKHCNRATLIGMELRNLTNKT